MITASSMPQLNIQDFAENTWTNWRIQSISGEPRYHGKVVQLIKNPAARVNVLHISWNDPLEPDEMLIADYVAMIAGDEYYVNSGNKHYVLYPPVPAFCKCSVSGYHEG